ncbi:hypothetical protein PC118_g21517 [Phytophthora cactorum]|uniref:Uncharacterized protein n=1 Tax=Phytophthora cactorum TaxID=29920 RepID=A0A8T1EVT1_9STRA|nr:hypothetical protein PC118_g21517 [Phytophthora cactorum]
MLTAKKRHSYSLQFKLSVANECKPNVVGHGFHALAKKHHVTSSMARQWCNLRDEQTQASKDRRLATRSLRRMPGAGRKPEHHQLEQQLHVCVATRHKKELRVKDKYILLHALNVHRSLTENATKTTEDIARALQLCGLVAKAEFNVDKVHPPLRELLRSTVNMHEWHQRYQHIADGSDDREELCISPPGWYLMDDIHSSLFCCLRHSLGASYADYESVLTDYIQELEGPEGLFDDEYVASLRSGELAAGELELFAASRMHICDIEVI